MKEIITYKGIIQFEPENRTKKHNSQASWKKIAMVIMKGEITEYYAWFINKRYNLELNKPLRGAHISFINDSIRDINGGKGSLEEREAIWEDVKKRWNGREVEIVLNLNPRTNTTHWWLNVPEEYRTELHNIRTECGLGRPNWGIHMSIGYANEKMLFHSGYIHSMIRNGFILT